MSSHTASGVPRQESTTTPMIRLRGLLLVGLSAAALLMPTFPANASAPPPVSVPPGDQPVGDLGAGNPAPGEVVHSWALAPAGSDTSSGAGNRSTLSYAADPGSVIQDAVTLYNLGTEALTFRVYATDAFNNADGSFDLLPGSETPKGAGAWLSVQQEMITVNPNRQVTIPITLSVPADAAPGDYAGAVLASSETLSTGEAGDLVTLDRRTGTRMVVRVAGALTPNVAVTNISTDYSPSLNPLAGSAEVTHTLENRGNVRLSGTSTVSVAGPFGAGRVSAESVQFEDLLPGQSIDFAVTLDDVPAFGLAFTQIEVVPTGEGVEVETVSASSFTFAPPVAVLLGLLILLFGLLGVRAYRRHRSESEPPAGSEPPPDPSVSDVLEHQTT